MLAPPFWQKIKFALPKWRGKKFNFGDEIIRGITNMNLAKEIFKLICVLTLLIILIWGWYFLFPSRAHLSWLVATIILISIFGRDYKFFDKK